VVIIIVIVVLFAWPKVNDPYKTVVAGWHDAGVDCLPSHQNARLHIHPQLTVTVDGSSETIPANTGIVRGCMAETHTHDTTGTIHVEAIDTEKKLTLGQFFAVWGKPLMRDGYNVEVKVDGAVIVDSESTIFRDKQKIEITYTKK